MEKFGIWESILVSIVLTPVALVLGLFSVGAGHGDYFLAKILFPFTMLSTVFTGGITDFFFLVAALQLPFYGLIIAVGIKLNKSAFFARGLLAVHIIAVILCFCFVGDHFS